MRVSLRGQIALWYALTLPLLIFGLAFVAQQVLVVSLRTTIDHGLRERTETVARSLIPRLEDPVGGSYTSLLDWLAEQEFTSIPLLLRTSDPQGRVFATFGEIPEQLIPYMDVQLSLAHGEKGQFDTMRIRGEEALRIYTVPVRSSPTSEPLALIQTGDSLAQVAVAQGQLWRYTLAVGIGGSLVALIIGLLIIQRGFRPLDSILSRVREIESKNLKEGLPEEPRPPELQRLADSLNTMLRRLDTAFRAREVFLASVSHDLRTPLTALQGQIEVLLMRPLLDSSSIKHSLDRMSKEIHRLVRMTNNLLLNAQLESSPAFVAAPVNLAGLLEEVVAEIWPMTEGLELRVSAPEAVVVLGDQDLLKQMVLNVTDNAIKFTPKGGSVELVLSQEEGWAALKVSDSGEGIPQEDLPHIMEPFYKASSPVKARRGGAGMGLAIVKQIIELHGGQIEIQSQQGTGTTVKIRLPLSHAHQQ